LTLATPADPIIWIRVERPTFDLAGVILSSLGITGICVGVALCLGTLFGSYLILSGKRRQPPLVVLHLELQASPPAA
jgi:hypothetical protein